MFVPRGTPPPPPPPVVANKTRYDVDYSRFESIGESDSEASDTERQLLTPSLQKRIETPSISEIDGLPNSEEDLCRELETHIASLSAREAVSAIRAAEREMREPETQKPRRVYDFEQKPRVKKTEVKHDTTRRRHEPLPLKESKAAVRLVSVDHLASIKRFNVAFDAVVDDASGNEFEGNVARFSLGDEKYVDVEFPVHSVESVDGCSIKYDRLSSKTASTRKDLDYSLVFDDDCVSSLPAPETLECRICGASLSVHLPKKVRQPPSPEFVLSAVQSALTTGSEEDEAVAENALKASRPLPGQPIECDRTIRIDAADSSRIKRDAAPRFPPSFLVPTGRDRKATSAQCEKCGKDLGYAFKDGPICLYKHRLRGFENDATNFVASLIADELRNGDTRQLILGRSGFLRITILGDDGHVYTDGNGLSCGKDTTIIRLKPALKLAYREDDEVDYRDRKDESVRLDLHPEDLNAFREQLKMSTRENLKFAPGWHIATVALGFL